MTDNDLKINSSPQTWFEKKLPLLCMQNAKLKNIAVVSHGNYIRNVMKMWGYDIHKLLNQPSIIKEKKCSQHVPLGKEEIPNTSVWNQIFHVTSTGILHSKKFLKYYTPPENIWPFLSHDKKKRYFTKDEIKSCDFMKLNNIFIPLK